MVKHRGSRKVKHRGSRKGKKTSVRRTRRNRMIRGGNDPEALKEREALEKLEALKKKVIELIYAIRATDKEKVEAILTENKDTAKGVLYKGIRYLPLIEAVIKADTDTDKDTYNRETLEIVKKLIDADADPTTPDTAGMIPLTQAIISSNRELIEILIKKLPNLDDESKRYNLDDESMRYIKALPKDSKNKKYLQTLFNIK
jgi:ankyrin repeat protein